MVAPGDEEEILYELRLEEVWRNGVSPLFKFVADFFVCNSGVEDRRSGFRGLKVEGTRDDDGDSNGTVCCGEEPLRCSLGVFRGVFAGDDGGSGVSAVLSRVRRLKISGRVVPLFVDKFEFAGVDGSSFSIDGRAMS